MNSNSRKQVIDRTINSLNTLSSKNVTSGGGRRQGGGAVFDSDNEYPLGDRSYVTAAIVPDGYKPFTISIENKKNESVVALSLIINPIDIQIGQTFVNNSSYTRKGWVTNLWGKQPGTIAASGSTAGFILDTTGLTNFKRKDSISFLNLQSFVALFKNNGSNFNIGINESALFSIIGGTEYSRVIDVLDSVVIDFDGTRYVGSFNSFNIDDDSSMPYRLTYNFEFIFLGFGGDIIEGHVRENNYRPSNKLSIKMQGYNLDINSLSLEEQKITADSAYATDRLDKSGKVKVERAMDLTGSNKNYDRSKYSEKQLAIIDANSTLKATGEVEASFVVTGNPVRNVKQFCENFDSALSAVENDATINGIKNTAKGAKVSKSLIMGQVAQESGGDPYAQSPFATGLTQFIPSTASEYGMKPVILKNSDPNGPSKNMVTYDPQEAINAQAHFMADLMRYYSKSPYNYSGKELEKIALVAYNSGKSNTNKAIKYSGEKIGKSNPTFDEMVAAKATYPPYKDKYGVEHTDTPALPKESAGYVPRIMGFQKQFEASPCNQ